MAQVQIVAVSDTHLIHPELPDGDILIHAGDACNSGTFGEFYYAMQWLESQPHRHKIYVPGNHDRWAYDMQITAHNFCKDRGIEMLVDRKITVEGICFYGAPWTRMYGRTQAFMYDPVREYEVWRKLRKEYDSWERNIDILITHCPPVSVLDNNMGVPLGSPELMQIVQVLRPRYHIFGHIHDNHGGSRKAYWNEHEQTIFHNVARTGPDYRPVSDPVLKFSIDK